MENNVLQLVPSEPGLADALAAYYRRNREFLKPFEPEREEVFFTSGYQREILEKEVEERMQKSAYHFYIRLLDRPDQIIGAIALTNVVWGAFCSAFLGGKLDQDHINKGYTTMAIAMVVDYAFKKLGLHRIEANVMPRNRRSLRALEKNGFENEGISKYYLRINGVWEDHVHMVKLNCEMHEEK